MIQTQFALFAATTVTTAGGALVHTLTAAELAPHINHGFSRCFLYVHIDNFTSTPSLAIQPVNVVLGDQLTIMSKAFTASGVTSVLMMGFTATNEGDYSTNNDGSAFPHAGALINFTCSGGSAEVDVAAQLNWFKT